MNITYPFHILFNLHVVLGLKEFSLSNACKNMGIWTDNRSKSNKQMYKK